MEPDYTNCQVIDGKTFCEVPGTELAGASGALTGTPATGPGLFDWAEPILADPMGWAETNLLQPDILVPASLQLAVIFGVLFLGFVLAPWAKRIVMRLIARLPKDIASHIDETVPRLVRPALWASGLYIAQTIMAGAGQTETLVRISVSLALAWLLIRLVTTFLPKQFRKLASWSIWLFAVFYAFGVLDEVMAWLSNVGPVFSGKRLSPPFIVQAILTVGLFMFGANWMSKRLKVRVDDLPKVEPSIRILMANAIQIGLFFAAAMLAMAGLGIPLSGLAVLGGAIGVGLGFGMQQIVANFISGVILLTDRSIKPDDVIEVDEQYGVVKSLGLRYASVVTRDGKEHLIPNEMLITDKVTNWSYSDNNIRIKRTLRVEYESDVELALRLLEEGAAKVDRVLKDPAPKGIIKEFGEEAIDVEIRFWINDPANGVSGVASDVLRAIWKLFGENGIDIPLRREEVLIEPGSTIKVEMIPPQD